MKKTLLITLASIALVSCSQDETVATMDRAAIAFDKVFVANSTSARAAVDLTAENLRNFTVYGSVVKEQQKGNIFNNQLVSEQAGAYIYAPAQYWIPGADYHFTAIAPNTDAQWEYACREEDKSPYGTRQAHYGTITFDNGAAKAEQDLLWAYTPASTMQSTPDVVNFSFHHMLSRAKFTFVNDFAVGSNISLKVKAVTITDAHSEGTLQLQGTEQPDMQWTATGTTFSKLFGNAQYVKNSDGTLTTLGENDVQAPQVAASTDHYYLLPVADATYQITFTIELYQAGVLLQTITKTASVAMPSTMQRGYSYDLKAKLNASNVTNDGSLETIEFNVTGVDEWKDYLPPVDANIATQTPGTNE